MCSLQSVLWRTGVEGCRWQITTAELSEQGWSRTEIRNMKQRTDIGKYSFVNRTIRLWSRLPAEILATFSCKPNCFRKTARRVIDLVNWRKSELFVNYLKVQWSEVKCSAVKGGKSGSTVKGIYGWWSEVKVLLKLLSYTCGITILETRYSNFSPLCCFSYVHCC